MAAGGVGAGPGDSYGGYRAQLVETLRRKGIRDLAVLHAVAQVPRHLFVPASVRHRAYEDSALPIAAGQTISQPYVQALYLEALALTGREKVLEIGTGSGYQAAILAALGLEVHTVERIGELLRTARKRFRQLGLNVRSKHDDGRIGWPENGPFDAIIVTAAAPALVDALTAQLAPGGTLIAPVGGSSSQSLLQLRKDAEGNVSQTTLAPVVFVPLLSGMID
jgi:protein-L-isoaspartate(D-aspartate) O-methyltransferase